MLTPRPSFSAAARKPRVTRRAATSTSAAPAPGPPDPQAWRDGSVQVSGKSFVLRNSGKPDAPFRFTGTNCYYLLDQEGFGQHDLVASTLRDIANSGMRVVRTWAFNDGIDNVREDGQGKIVAAGKRSNGAQPTQGDTANARRWVRSIVEEARRNNIKLIFSLLNFWPDYGGMLQYVCWAKGISPLDLVGRDFRTEACQFYGNDDIGQKAQGFFKQYVRDIVGEFKDDPAIFAWSICNEPRFVDNGDRSTVARWAQRMVRFIKQDLGATQLVTLDTDGFLDVSGGVPPKCSRSDIQLWYSNNFRAEAGPALEPAGLPLDYANIHMYVDSVYWVKNWVDGADNFQAQLEFATDWIQCHANICNELGKPLVIGEFGFPMGQPGDVPHRKRFFEHVYYVANEEKVGGTLYWHTGSPVGPINDNLIIYLSSDPNANGRKREGPTAGVIEGQAAQTDSPVAPNQ